MKKAITGIGRSLGSGPLNSHSVSLYYKQMPCCSHFVNRFSTSLPHNKDFKDAAKDKAYDAGQKMGEKLYDTSGSLINSAKDTMQDVDGSKLQQSRDFTEATRDKMNQNLKEKEQWRLRENVSGNPAEARSGEIPQERQRSAMGRQEKLNESPPEVKNRKSELLAGLSGAVIGVVLMAYYGGRKSKDIDLEPTNPRNAIMTKR